MKLFSISTACISCSPLFLLLLAAACVCGNGGIFALHMIAVALHEVAHWVMARLLGCSITTIKVMPYGCSAELSGLPDAFDELLVAVAGPVCSFVIYMGCNLINNGTVQEFAAANAYIGAINMLPAYPLDGGRVTGALLRLKGIYTEKVYRTVSAVVAGGAVLFVGACEKNITLMVFGLFLLHSALLLKQETRPAVVGHITRLKKLNDVGWLEAEYVAVNEGMQLWQALERCRGERYTVLLVIDSSANWVCSLTCTQIVQLCAKYGGERRITDIDSLTRAGIGDRINIGKND